MLGRSAVRRIFERTCGVDFLRNRFTNKSTAFTRAEREHLGLVGLLPPTEETLEEQAKRCWEQIKLTNDPISKYRALQEVLSDNVTLYYKVVNANLTDVLPLIYTPTVGEVCERYSNLFTRDQALYLSCKERGTVRQAIKNLHQSDVDIIVVTDGSRILGLGDLGVNGVGISIGKCSLYVAAGGIHPGRALPVVLDVGTNTKRLLEDPMYIGLRSPRASDEDFYALLDEFMDAAREEWPNAVVQFEDFSTNHCFDMLDRYQNKYRCFNDDIQGTGAVIAAGFLNAIHASGLPIEDHRIVVFGAGSAAVGVAQFIVDLVARTYKKTTEEVRKAVYLIDTKGLVTTTRGDTLAAHKVSWARTDITAEQSNSLRTLLDVVKFVKPTALIGLGAQGGVFTEDVVRLMASNCKRPVLFPLSNPSSKAEIIPEDAYKWTDGAAIVASGSPFPPCVLNGKQLSASQGNNLYVFPGIGLGCALAQPPYIPHEALAAAAAALSQMVDREVVVSESKLYPPIESAREVSKNVAVAVIEELQQLGLAKEDLPCGREALIDFVQGKMWQPEYLESDFYLSRRLD
ncbi:Malic enzyme N terminal domain [Trypanosoma vivax]|uniref:Malic enzyme n=1 Tax=Trypanosoma vivax (strain Y486) TaxID=1055687 RepID=G0UB92_TRYVY|nr:Malic enzyme N terminal domain [Trypanosoma vivax]CCC53079.1 putative malic enzyme [Trypanosoma vivax Y486]